jgi:hypothetical protein
VRKAVRNPSDLGGNADVRNLSVEGDPLFLKGCGQVSNRGALIDGTDLGAFVPEILAERSADAACRACDRNNFAPEHHAAASISARPSGIQSRFTSRR